MPNLKNRLRIHCAFWCPLDWATVSPHKKKNKQQFSGRDGRATHRRGFFALHHGVTRRWISKSFPGGNATKSLKKHRNSKSCVLDEVTVLLQYYFLILSTHVLSVCDSHAYPPKRRNMEWHQIWRKSCKNSKHDPKMFYLYSTVNRIHLTQNNVPHSADDSSNVAYYGHLRH